MQLIFRITLTHALIFLFFNGVFPVYLSGTCQPTTVWLNMLVQGLCAVAPVKLHHVELDS